MANQNTVMQHQEDASTDQIQISLDGNTVWVHSFDGSTVGRFSKRFGMDVHNTVTAQMDGASQCLCCTHSPPGEQEWLKFIDLMQLHHGICVAPGLIRFNLDASL